MCLIIAELSVYNVIEHFPLLVNESLIIQKLTEHFLFY